MGKLSLDELREEVEEAWNELGKVEGAAAYPRKGGPLWEAIETLRLTHEQADLARLRAQPRDPLTAADAGEANRARQQPDTKPARHNYTMVHNQYLKQLQERAKQQPEVSPAHPLCNGLGCQLLSGRAERVSQQQPEHCEECDPAFECFTDRSRCRKQQPEPQPAAEEADSHGCTNWGDRCCDEDEHDVADVRLETDRLADGDRG